MDEEKPLNFKSIKHDPESLIGLLNKYVKVQLIKNTSFKGFIHSLDPLTHSIILSVPKGAAFQTTLVPGHAILEVSEIPTDLAPPSKALITVPDDEDTLQRKSRLIEWFKKNLLPTTENENQILVGSAHLLPPYSVMDIYADNPVIVTQVRKLIEQMPADYAP